MTAPGRGRGSCYRDRMSELPGILTCADVARMWGVKLKTVYAALDASKPGDARTGRKPGRYAGNPVPAPDGYLGQGRNGNRPWWRAERAGELAAWRESLPGRGAGGGRPRRKP